MTDPQKTWNLFRNIFTNTLPDNGPIPWCGKIGKGIFPRSGEATTGEIKISPGVTKGTFYFPQEWLSRIGEEKFPQERRSRDWGNFFSP